MRHPAALLRAWLLPAWWMAALGWATLGLAALGLTSLPALAQDVQNVPALTAHVIDQAEALNAQQRQALETKLTGVESSLGSQMVVLLVPTTQPEDIAAYAQRVGDTWKIGRKEVGDGLIIVVAVQDRRVRIEVAKTLEGAIPDLAAKRIIDGVIKPAFKAGDYAGGLNAAVDHLAARIRGENLPLPTARDAPRERNRPNIGLDQLLMFGLIATPIVAGILKSILGRGLGSVATGALGAGVVWLITSSLILAGLASVVAFIVALAMGSGGRGHGGWGGPPFGGGWGGGGSGWGGGGGFSSGGGGDFGGGGASGDW